MSLRLPILNMASNQRNGELLSQFLGKEGYQSVSVTTIPDFERMTVSETRFGLAIVDIAGFDRRIWRCCEGLSKISVPLVVVVPKPLQHMHHKCFSHGAQRVFVKPLLVKELLESVRMLCLEDRHG